MKKQDSRTVKNQKKSKINEIAETSIRQEQNERGKIKKETEKNGKKVIVEEGRTLTGMMDEGERARMNGSDSTRYWAAQN